MEFSWNIPTQVKNKYTNYNVLNAFEIHIFHAILQIHLHIYVNTNTLQLYF